MKTRWIWFWLCALLGVVDLACGWVVPAYLRAVDRTVLEKAGKRTTTLAERGLEFVKENKLGPAELLLEAARIEGIPDRAQLGLAVTNLALGHPSWKVWGGGEGHCEIFFGALPRPRQNLSEAAAAGADQKNRAESESEPLTEW